MERRTYLAAGLGVAAASAGCLTTVLGDSTTAGETVLDPPRDRQFDSSDLPYPAHGEALPAFSLPDPLADGVVDSTAIDGTLVVTGFFASCPVECVRLVGQLAGVQHGTLERGIGDEVTFLAITFDPERDDAAALRENAETIGVDRDAGNWRYLRPETPARAKTVVEDRLGIGFERTTESDRLPGYDFTHLVVTLLVNPDGVVERAYRGERVDPERVAADVERVVAAFADD